MKTDEPKKRMSVPVMRAGDFASQRNQPCFYLFSSVFIGGSRFSPSNPIACELPRDAPAAEAALERPKQRGAARLFRRLAAERAHPVVGDVEVLLLVEGIEREPQPEA